MAGSTKPLLSTLPLVESFSNKPERLASAKTLFWIGATLIGVFCVRLGGDAIPVKLLIPSWQALVISSLLGSAFYPLVAAMLILLAQQFDSEAFDLSRWVKRLRLLSIPVAISFFLIIPLQSSVGLKLLNQARDQDRQFLSVYRNAATAIQSAANDQELRQAVGMVPGVPPTLGNLAVPFAQAKQQLSQKLGAQIKQLETQAERQELNRKQKAFLGWARDSLLALCYGMGFAAIGRTPLARSSFLDSILAIGQRKTNR